MFRSLFEPQSRRMQQAFGVAALVAGCFGLLLAVWLRLGGHEKGWPIPLAAVLAGGYSLVLARRLLDGRPRRYLLSQLALVVMGTFVIVGAVLPVYYGLEGRFTYMIEGIALGIGAFTYAWRQRRASEDATHSATGET